MSGFLLDGCRQKVGKFSSPSGPDFTPEAPDGYVVGADIQIVYYAALAAGIKDISPLTAKIVSFDADTGKDGIVIFDEHEFQADQITIIDCNPGQAWQLNSTWPIPADTVVNLKPAWDAVKIVLYNSTAASVDPDDRGIYHFSTGFYLTDNRTALSQPDRTIIYGTDRTGRGAVVPPSNREIAKQGGIGISIGLGAIFIALLGQFFFLKFRHGGHRRNEGGTWQEKMMLRRADGMDNQTLSISEETGRDRSTETLGSGTSVQQGIAHNKAGHQVREISLDGRT